MIVTQITSGLGNQMFQYAAGCALAERVGTGLLVDLDFYSWNTLRKYELGRFAISAREIGPSDRFRINLGAAEPKGRRIALLRRLPLWRYTPVVDPHAGVDARPLDRPDNTLLLGYWQAENYFRPARERIVREFQFKHPPDPVNAEMLAVIGGGESVCVHVRRGDYTKPGEVLTALSSDYYVRALDWIRARVESPRFFVFSDEPGWAKQNLPLPASTVFVTHNTGVNDPEDLRLMSACRHFVIANSTFSWWGAWLSGNPRKKVVAPARWFCVPRGDETGMVPPEWTRL